MVIGNYDKIREAFEQERKNLGKESDEALKRQIAKLQERIEQMKKEFTLEGRWIRETAKKKAFELA